MHFLVHSLIQLSKVQFLPHTTVLRCESQDGGETGLVCPKDTLKRPKRDLVPSHVWSSESLACMEGHMLRCPYIALGGWGVADIHGRQQ